MKNVSIVQNSEFGQIQIITKDNKEYFEATKTAKTLGYKNTHDAIKRHCNKDGVVFHEVKVKYKKYDKYKTVCKKFISEGNLYRLIAGSKLESAKRFESWIFDEVLPSIRKNGLYASNYKLEEILNNPDMIIDLALKLKYEKEKVKNLNNVINHYKPYIQIGKTIEKSEDIISIGTYAKLINTLGIDIGRNRLFNWFRDNGYLMKHKNSNEPKQIYIEQGLFKTKQFTINTQKETKIRITTYITGKGQKYFIDKIREDMNNEKIYQQI